MAQPHIPGSDLDEEALTGHDQPSATRIVTAALPVLCKMDVTVSPQNASGSLPQR